MITYRLAEFGVERIENGRSTFVHEDASHSAWREYQAWKACGNRPLTAPPRPAFEDPSLRKDLWIVGAGGYGREIFSMAKSARGHGVDWNIAGFLNDIPDALDGFEGLPPISGTTDYEPLEKDLFICAIGDVGGRKAVCTKMQSRGARFANLVQPSVCLSPRTVLGEGIIIEAFSGIGADAQIGYFCSILSHVSIGHDVRMGKFVQVSPFASILGRAEIGDEVLIGSHAVILPDIKIGAGATVGAGSVVIKDVPEGATVFGVPAKQIK